MTLKLDGLVLAGVVDATTTDFDAFGSGGGSHPSGGSHQARQTHAASVGECCPLAMRLVFGPHQSGGAVVTLFHLHLE